MAGHVYAVGGFNGSLRVRTVDVYDGVKDQWTSIASMQERRSTLGAAVLNDLLYAVGGFDGSTGRSRMWSLLLLAWDMPSVQPWFAQPFLGPTFCPSTVTSTAYSSFLISYLLCQSQALLHMESITAHVYGIISRVLGSLLHSEGVQSFLLFGNSLEPKDET